MEANVGHVITFNYAIYYLYSCCVVSGVCVHVNA